MLKIISWLFHNLVTINRKYIFSPQLLGFIVVSLIAPIHIYFLYYFWSNYSRLIDKTSCTCSCWDTIFKGPYESGIPAYKHFYFNATQSSLKIWIISVVFVVSLYESIRHLASLWIKRRLRHELALLFATSIFSHYYSWWAYVNYYNDEFYSQWNHQLLFTATEVFSSWQVVALADTRQTLSPRRASLVWAVALLHAVAGVRDQFLDNVIKGEGATHQVIRDLFFMIPDLLHLLIPPGCVVLRCSPAQYFNMSFAKHMSILLVIVSALLIVAWLL